MRTSLLALCAFLFAAQASAQTTIQRDPQLAKAVANVSSDSLRSYINKLVSFGTRHTMSSPTDPKRGIGAAREWVVQKFREFGKAAEGRMNAFVDTVTLQPDGRRVDAATLLGNAMGILKGTDPADDRVYIISGHIDSRVTDVMNRNAEAPGANDDGSGVAAVLECARVLSAMKFPATIFFVAVAGEEQSLLGSTYLANKAKAANWNIDAVLNNDIMGSNNSNETAIIDNTKLRVFSEAFSVQDTGRAFQNIRNLGLENDGRPRQLARYVKEVGERYVDNLQVMLIYRNDRFLRGGDHTSFVNKGYTAVRLTEMNENFNHQHQDLRTDKGVVYGDLPEFMDFEYLRKNTAVNLSVLASLASAPSVPQDVKVETRNLTNSTQLAWKVPKVGKPKGYYVLLRETTSAVWQKKFFTPETSISLPYSKDNYFFAVQAVSENGFESLMVVPTPAR
ncbi:MAG: M20/M25/M40 family metallo-hydrolase [Chitinophagaceae bacterium]|nr:MAG: M20/M25/M40 family metallo-hydrolase [Chitinophagaceae bacterium]